MGASILALGFASGVFAFGGGPEPLRVFYIDGDSSCPGTGTNADPFCGLVEATGALTLAPGDAIRIRNSTIPIDGANIGGLGDGTATNPIVVEADIGHQPLIDGRLRLANMSYWTVRNLTFENGPFSMLESRAETVNVEGIEFSNNRIAANNGDRGVHISSAAGFTNEGAAIIGNLIVDVIGVGIRLEAASDVRIESNRIVGMRCTDPTATDAVQIGILVEDNSSNISISHNVVEDFPDDCVDPFYRYGIRIRASTTGTVERNVVRGIPDGDAHVFVGGLSIHEGASGWLFRRNLVTGIGGCSVCDGIDAGQTTDTRWLNNTLIGGGYRTVRFGQSNSATFLNNLVVGDPSATLEVGSNATLTQWDNNLYFLPGATPFVYEGTPSDFAGWLSACSCDGAGMNDDPLLPSTADSFTPGATSPAIDIGAPTDDPFAGQGPDAGAFEPPIASAAARDGEDPTTVVVTFATVPFGPLGPASDCAGVSLDTPAGTLRPDNCALVDEGAGATWRLSFGGLDPSEFATLRYRDGSLVDAVGVGNLGARVQPFELIVDGETDGGTSGSGGATGTSSSGGGSEGSGASTGDPSATDSAGGDESFPDPDLGCGCSSLRPKPSGIVVLALGLLGFRRRNPFPPAATDERGSHSGAPVDHE